MVALLMQRPRMKAAENATRNASLCIISALPRHTDK